MVVVKKYPWWHINTNVKITLTWRIMPHVPTRQAMVKIHKNNRSRTIATYFQSSMTLCVMQNKKNITHKYFSEGESCEIYFYLHYCHRHLFLYDLQCKEYSQWPSVLQANIGMKQRVDSQLGQFFQLSSWSFDEQKVNLIQDLPWKNQKPLEEVILECPHLKWEKVHGSLNEYQTTERKEKKSYTHKSYSIVVTSWMNSYLHSCKRLF